MLNQLKTKYCCLPLPVKASLWFFVCAFLQKAISAITVPIFTRLMTSSEFGAYNVFLSWQSLVNCIVTLNLYGGFYTQGLTKFQDKRDKFSASLQGLTIAMVATWTVVYLVLREPVNRLFDITTVQMLYMFLSIWAMASFSFWSVEQRVQYRYKKLVIITAVSAVCIPLVGILAVLFGTDKVTSRIAATAVASVVCYAGLCFAQLQKGKCVFSKEYWPYALGFAVPLVPHYLSQIVLSNSDRIMISNIVDSSAAGIYSLAYQIAQIMMLFNTALLQTIEPWIYKRIQKDEIEQIQGIAFPLFVFVSIVNLLLIAFAPEVVRIFAPVEYHGAIWVIPPIAMSVVFMFQYSFFALFEFYYEKTTHIALATMAGAVLNVLLNYVFIRKYGYYAAGYTTLICYMVYVLVHYCFMKGICKRYHSGKKPYNGKLLIGFSCAFLLLGFGLLLTYQYFVLRVCLLLIFVTAALVNRKQIICYVKHLASIRKK